MGIAEGGSGSCRWFPIGTRGTRVFVCVRAGGYHIKEEGLHGSKGGRPGSSPRSWEGPWDRTLSCRPT